MSNQKVEPIYLAVGRNVTTRRIVNRWSQAQLGRMLRPPVTRACIANLERGNQRVMLHMMEQLAELFGCHLAQLITGSRRRRATLPAGAKAEFGARMPLERA